MSQPDGRDGHELNAGATVSASEGEVENAQSTSGIVYVTAETFVDKGSGTVTLSGYALNADFTSADPKDEEAWVAALKQDAG